jgi:hypothetical protein
VNQALTTLAIAWRDLAKQTVEQWQFLNRLGDTGLEAVGFSAGDAATVLTLVDYMNTVAQVYLGTVQSQGSGGTGAILFNFDSALTPLWAGQ